MKLHTIQLKLCPLIFENFSKAPHAKFLKLTAMEDSPVRIGDIHSKATQMEVASTDNLNVRVHQKMQMQRNYKLKKV